MTTTTTGTVHGMDWACECRAGKWHGVVSQRDRDVFSAIDCDSERECMRALAAYVTGRLGVSLTLADMQTQSVGQ